MPGVRKSIQRGTRGTWGGQGGWGGRGGRGGYTAPRYIGAQYFAKPYKEVLAWMKQYPKNVRDVENLAKDTRLTIPTTTREAREYAA
eukprot:COSAG02_NODE_1518_length_12179_cov_6.141060_5_plen_87_part_00